MPEPTPFQTVGPYFEVLMPAVAVVRLADERVVGERIRIQGVVRDGGGVAVPDAVVETWQADAGGRYPDPEAAEGFVGFARMPTKPDGSFSLETIHPGRVPGPDGQLQAPHLVVGVLARGLLGRLVTRIYFEDEPANDADPVLAL